MRKALLILAIALLVLAPVGAYALIANSPARGVAEVAAEQQELTPEQQADLAESYQQMIDLRKESIDKLVADGLLTAEQGQLEKDRLDAMAQYHAENGYVYGYGAMGGCYGDFDRYDTFDQYDGYYGRGMMRGYNWNDTNDQYDGYYGRGMMRGYDWNDTTDQYDGYYGPGMMRGYSWN